MAAAALEPKEADRTRRAAGRGWLVLALLVAGCTGSQSFAPMEHATARSTTGHSAAEYELAPPGGKKVGEVRVWSEGGEADGTSDATVWHIGFEIESGGDEPLEIEQRSVRIDSAHYLGVQAKALRPVRVEGDSASPSRSTVRLDVYFRLPGVDPHDIDAFTVRWTARSGRHEWSQVTTFVQTNPARAYAYPAYWGPYPPYYGPYYYGRPIYYYRPAMVRPSHPPGARPHP